MQMMQNDEAVQSFRQGMQFLHADRLQEALQSFSRAIALDPNYAAAYRNRGEIFNLLGRVVEANSDLQKAKALEGSMTGSSVRKAGRKVKKVDLKSVHSIYDDLLASDPRAGEARLEFAGELYDYVFSDDTLESDNLLSSLVDEGAPSSHFPSILEYLDGRREEGLITKPFGPDLDRIVLESDGQGARTVSLELLSCVRLARVPEGFGPGDESGGQVEVIETIDGNIYHESIHPEQTLKNVLFGFSTKKDSRFRYTLIPRISIRKRYQRRQLGQILLDRKLIAWEVLEQALAEHDELKKVKFGKIIAQHAGILYSAVEAEIQRAYVENRHGMKVGEILLNAGLVSEAQIIAALQQQERLRTKKLGQFLVEKGILQERDIYMALAEKFRMPFVELRQQKVTRTVLARLPGELIRKLHVLPLDVREETLVVATLLPEPGPLCEVVHRYAGTRNVEFVLVQPTHLKNVIRVLFRPQVEGNS